MNSTIQLTEIVNEKKLLEVIACDNIPFGESDEPEWKQKFILFLNSYKNKQSKNGYRTVNYNQKNHIGRYYANNGLQLFQRDVRKYISGEFYEDIDIINCHPKILQQLFQKNDIATDKFLEEYNTNRDLTIEKYNLNSKLDVIKLINNEINIDSRFSKLHDLIYKNLVPTLKTQNKDLFNLIKKNRTKNKKNYNINGSFLSQFLQIIENDILMVMFNYFKNQHYEIGVLCFDGLMVLKDNRLNSEVLKKLEEHVFEQTGFNIELKFKDMTTDWIPVEIEDAVKKEEDLTGKKFSVEKARELSNFKIQTEDGIVVDERKRENFFKYINTYVCCFDNPHCYGWKLYPEDAFRMILSKSLKEKIGSTVFNIWSSNDNALTYRKAVFQINKKDKEDEYNLYTRPKMAPGEIPNVVFDFLERVICSSDKDLYEYLLNYMSVLLQTGRTNQCIVLMGLKGTGKSTFIELCAELVGVEYFSCVNDIHQITSKFNGLYERNILTGIEEVVNEAGDYHRVQNILKTLITERYKTIEKKGIDSYVAETYNNYIISTNNMNPVQITEDNRRFCIIEVSNCEIRNRAYFKELKEAIYDNIENIRHYFYNKKVIHSLETIRPITKKESELKELNLTSSEKFIKDVMCLSRDVNDNCRLFSFVYDAYKDFCKDDGYKAESKKYFAMSIKKAGFSTYSYGKYNKTYISGNHNEHLYEKHFY